MATVAVIFGGMVGFFSALISLVVFNASWIFALGVWSMAGFGVALLLVVMAVTPRREGHALEAEHA